MADHATKTLEEIKAEARRYALATTKVQRAPYAPAYLAPAPPVAAATTEHDDGIEAAGNNGDHAVVTEDHHPPPKPPAVSIDDEEYLRFVIGLNDNKDLEDTNDLDDEFQLDPLDDDDDDDDADTISLPVDFSLSPDATVKEDHLDDNHMDWDIREELGWLQEDDDMDLTLTNLVHDETPDKKATDEDEADIQWIDQLSGLANTPHDRTNPPLPTTLQQEKLRNLLKRHYQLLLQQAIMAVRMAHSDKRKIKGRSNNSSNAVHKNAKNPPERSVTVENADDLIEIVDSAVGKLIDLRQQRQDSFRSILAPQQDTLLTRAQFRKVKETVEGLHTMTLFDVPGLDELDDTFTSIDQSVNGLTVDNNILWMDKHSDACHKIFKDRKLDYNSDLVPGARDISCAFSNPMEVLGTDFHAPCNQSQELFLRRQRNLFTAAEDNLTIRGVNMFGEKHWLYISDRFLPDRSGNIISHRYAKLTTMIFQAHGITVRADGSLPPLKKITMIRDVDHELLDSLRLIPEPPHASVRKWSIEEDLALLNAAKVLGTMWAEISNRVLPHRDRGHLRKRYQVLERRIKATCSRDEKHGRTWRRREKSLKITAALAKPQEAGQTQQAGAATAAPPKQNNPNMMHNAIMPALQQFTASLPPNYSMSPPQMQMVPHQPYGWIQYGAMPAPYMPVATPPRGSTQMAGQMQPVHPMLQHATLQSPPHHMRTPGNMESNLGENSLAAVEKLISNADEESKGTSQQSLFSGVMQLADDDTAPAGASRSAKAAPPLKAPTERASTPPCYYPPSPNATIGTFADNTHLSRYSMFGQPSPAEAVNADQLEAASALSALSQSPALKKGSSPPSKKESSKAGRSLFSLVTGGANGSPKKKKADAAPKTGIPPAKRKKTSR